MTGKFPPGMYCMRNGERAEVFAERDGELWGRRITNGVWRSSIWAANGQWTSNAISNFDLLSPWTEERKPFECWVNIYESEGKQHVGAPHMSPQEAGVKATFSKIAGPIRMIESTPLTDAAGDLHWFVQQIFNGIDTGLLTIDTPANETLANIIARGRAALAKTGKP